MGVIALRVPKILDSMDDYPNDEGSVEVSQQGFTLNVSCTVDIFRPAVLTALVGRNVVGISSLNPPAPAYLEADTNIRSNVLFSLHLESNTLLQKNKDIVKIFLFNGKKSLLLGISCAELIVNAFQHIEDIKSVAPSYSFFGGGKNETLKVKVDAQISELCLHVESANTVLNLKALTLFDAQNNPIQIDEMISITCSSSKEKDLGSLKILEGRGFHSNLEEDPWLKVLFKKPTYLKNIELANRACKWGSRNQHLNISVLDKNGKRTDIYSPFGHSEIAFFYNKTARLLGLKALLISDKQVRRKVILAKLLNKVRKADVKPKIIKFALNFLSTWSLEKPAGKELNTEIMILAACIHHEIKLHLRFSLLPFARLLSNAKEIESLEFHVNKLRKKNELPEIKFTKHGIAKKGMLIQNVPEVIKTLEIVMADLREMGLKPALAYGTLLGAVREKQFIAHDDDVDILIEFNDENICLERAFELKDKLMKQFSTSKYRVVSGSKTVNNLNMHVFLKETNIMVDVFPYWSEGEKVFLHMEKMAIRGIPSFIFEGRAEVELYGKSFSGLAESEEFLRERYGEGWGISDKYHEWPWEVQIEEI